VPGGNPVTEVPGAKPKSPVTTEEPVLVIVEPARTAKLSAVPKFTVVAALALIGPLRLSINIANIVIENQLIIFISLNIFNIQLIHSSKNLPCD
jgi:hypothetical protein